MAYNLPNPPSIYLFIIVVLQRLTAEKILELSFNLTDNKKERILYISTDENNRTFFEPFMREFRAVRFLSDYANDIGLSEMNQNHLGMVTTAMAS